MDSSHPPQLAVNGQSSAPCLTSAGRSQHLSCSAPTLLHRSCRDCSWSWGGKKREFDKKLALAPTTHHQILWSSRGKNNLQGWFCRTLLCYPNYNCPPQKPQHESYPQTECSTSPQVSVLLSNSTKQLHITLQFTHSPAIAAGSQLIGLQHHQNVKANFDSLPLRAWGEGKMWQQHFPGQGCDSPPHKPQPVSHCLPRNSHIFPFWLTKKHTLHKAKQNNEAEINFSCLDTISHLFFSFFFSFHSMPLTRRELYSPGRVTDTDEPCRSSGI